MIHENSIIEIYFSTLFSNYFITLISHATDQLVFWKKIKKEKKKKKKKKKEAVELVFIPTYQRIRLLLNNVEIKHGIKAFIN
jgi:hypothetical protein